MVCNGIVLLPASREVPKNSCQLIRPIIACHVRVACTTANERSCSAVCISRYRPASNFARSVTCTRMRTVILVLCGS